MLVFAFRHVAIEHLGWIARALDATGVEFRYVDLYKEPTLHLELDAAAGLVFLGGPMSVNDEILYIRRELGFIEAALTAGKPMLGICLGSQLIAKALGANVYRNRLKEIGWGPVFRTEAGHRDALLAPLKEPETVLHWHAETFDLPAGATLLASSEKCQHQAFRYGSNVYGLQFHLEVTPDMIDDWSRAADNQADLSDLDEPIDPYAHQDRMRELSLEVFGAWGALAKNHLKRVSSAGS